MLKAPTFSDIALGQWLSLTPKQVRKLDILTLVGVRSLTFGVLQVVKDTLNLSDNVTEHIFSGEKTKHVVVGPR